jgi:threonine dehydrogenase-like Zn-dependent dehydrogenase
MIETRTVYLEPGKIEVRKQQLPELLPNQILVKTLQASVCGSERYFYSGVTVRPEDEARGEPEAHLKAAKEKTGTAYSYPMGPLGHEGGGTVEEVGSAVDEYLGGGKVSVGDRIGSLIYPTYTDYWVTDPSHVQPIPAGVSFEVGCLYEPLGCAAWAALHVGVTPGDWVAVNGVGFAGNIMLQGAIRAGASKVIAIDADQGKLEVAKTLGATHTLNINETDARAEVEEITNGEGADVSVEAVGGRGRGLKQCLDMVKHNGIMALYGDNYAPIDQFCFHRFHEDGLEVRNLNAVHYTHLRSIENMREAYRAVQRGVFDIDIIFENSVSHSMDDIATVFEQENAVAHQSSLKTLIIP